MDGKEHEPSFAHIPDLPGVWATGKTLEDCRNELISVIEGGIALRLRMGDPIPSINYHKIIASPDPVSVVQSAGSGIAKRA
jgi:predicted RNase H-like HicB family nuclease